MLEPIRVIDIPNGTSPADAERLLNTPYTDGFYLFAAVSCGDVTRAIFKILKREIARRRGPTKRSNKDGQEVEAVAIIREWPEDSLNELVERLKAAGIERGRSWINVKRRALQCNGQQSQTEISQA